MLNLRNRSQKPSKLMVPRRSGDVDNESRVSRLEFALIRWFLLAFVVVLFVILLLPSHFVTGDFGTDAEDVVGFRKEIISLVIAAFGPWIAAGAAYFFGRENLREAYRGMRALQEGTPEELLRSTQIKDLPPHPIEFKVKPDDPFKVIKDRIWQERSRWFFIYIDERDRFIAAISEEDIWRFRAQPDVYTIPQEAAAELPDDAADLSEDDILDQIKIKHILLAIARKVTEKPEVSTVDGINQSVLFRQDTSALVAEQMLNQEKKYIGVVADDDGKPTGYFTTGDIRRALTGSERNTDRV